MLFIKHLRKYTEKKSKLSGTLKIAFYWFNIFFFICLIKRKLNKAKKDLIKIDKQILNYFALNNKKISSSVTSKKNFKR